MLVKETLYSLDDVTIIGAEETDIRHRSEINPYYEDGNLPIFASPMDSVVNAANFEIWKANHIIPIMPRTESMNVRFDAMCHGNWSSVSLSEFEEMFVTKAVELNTLSNKHYKVLIDMAAGQLKSLQTAISKAKQLAATNGYTLEIMAGNVLNPKTYRRLALAGADYVRCAVGTGSVCITASNTANYYPMASLIDECKKLKDKDNLNCAIIADGGISNSRNIIKALALGADYVMMGGTLASLFESAASFVRYDKPKKDFLYISMDEINQNRHTDKYSEQEKKDIIKMYAPMVKTMYGMSTRKAQIAIARAAGVPDNQIKTKTSEGIEKEIRVEYTIAQWVENTTDAIRSSMSYNNAHNLAEFVGKPTLYLLSQAAINAINK